MGRGDMEYIWLYNKVGPPKGDKRAWYAIRFAAAWHRNWWDSTCLALKSKQAVVTAAAAALLACKFLERFLSVQRAVRKTISFEILGGINSLWGKVLLDHSSAPSSLLVFRALDFFFSNLMSDSCSHKFLSIDTFYLMFFFSFLHI